MQYYDNGKIFSLDPVKRMVLELSALVIYNHTLQYEFQSQKSITVTTAFSRKIPSPTCFGCATTFRNGNGFIS